MPNWVIQRVEALSIYDGRDLADGNEILLVDRFDSQNDFSDAFHKGGSTGVVQDDNGQGNDDGNDDGNIDEKHDVPPGIAL